MPTLRKQITCASCHKRSVIAKTALIQTYWYVSPYGCTGGDYWKAGEVQFLCHHCNHVNRLLHEHKVFDRNLNAEYFDANYRYSFKEIVKTHDDDSYTRTHHWVNNYWIDQLESDRLKAMKKTTDRRQPEPKPLPYIRVAADGARRCSDCDVVAIGADCDRCGKKFRATPPEALLAQPS